MSVREFETKRDSFFGVASPSLGPLLRKTGFLKVEFVDFRRLNLETARFGYKMELKLACSFVVNVIKCSLVVKRGPRELFLLLGRPDVLRSLTTLVVLCFKLIYMLK